MNSLEPAPSTVKWRERARNVLLLAQMGAISAFIVLGFATCIFLFLALWIRFPS